VIQINCKICTFSSSSNDFCLSRQLLLSGKISRLWYDCVCFMLTDTINR